MDPGVILRSLAPDELDALGTIDRGEHIDGQYVVADGRLRLEPASIDVDGWFPHEVDGYVARLREVLAAGGLAIGAFDADVLVGLAALDVRPVGGDPRVLDLDFLHVDRRHRHRGIARRLVTDVGRHARTHGATALYISATPTRNTVDAYLALGARLADPPDPALLAREPADIHLLLPL